nr:MAG TPA: hypothetical protein [Caudoviricetes sp.]
MLSFILCIHKEMRDVMFCIFFDNLVDCLWANWKPLGLSCISKSTLGFPIFQYGFRLYLHPHIEGSGTSRWGFSPYLYSFRIVVAPSSFEAWHRIIMVFVKIICAI